MLPKKKKKSIDEIELNTQKEKLKKLTAQGKIRDVLETLIRLNSHDSSIVNTCFLQLGRWDSINNDTDNAIITKEASSVELNRIKSAIFRMLDELENI